MLDAVPYSSANILETRLIWNGEKDQVKENLVPVLAKIRLSFACDCTDRPLSFAFVGLFSGGGHRKCLHVYLRWKFILEHFLDK